jgi:colanic acid biosynthesis glycosyl transferase WcaI
MRVAVHDYAGHPFQVELSRELARRGHKVLHLYSASITTPRGALTQLPQDSQRFSVESIELGQQISRDQLLARRRLEREHGARVADRLTRFAPDVVLSANAPLEAQRRIAAYCSRDGVAFVYWVQDLIGEATRRLLPKRLPGIARPVAWYYRNLERRLLWRADAVVVISEDFRPYVPNHAEVIENWAPLGDLPVLPKVNEWSRTHGLDTTTNLLYSGTLGMKHDPAVLLQIAETFTNDEQIRVVVISEGSGADLLRARAAEKNISNLVVLPFQPFDAVAAMLASGDVLIAVLERDAGVFSVPSKVLTYLCAGRPLLLAVPSQNLAARVVDRAGAGVVVTPEDTTGVVAAISRLLDEPSERAQMGARARAYAERTFDLGTIADRFESLLGRVVAADVPAQANGKARSIREPQPHQLPDGRRDTRQALVSVIIVSYACMEALRQCLVSLAAERKSLHLEVLVIDNASRDGTVDMVAALFPWVQLIENRENVGFARAANHAMRLATSDYLLFLNPDTIVSQGGLAATVAKLQEHPDVGILGCKLVRPDGTFDHACKRGFPTIATAFYYFVGLSRVFPRSRRFAQYLAGHVDVDQTAPVGSVNGAFMLVRREAAEDVGAMDESYWLYAEDLDWCRRFWDNGWKILYWPGVEVVHIKGASAGDHRSWKLNYAFHRSIWLFYRKHHAPHRSAWVSAVVWLGVWSKFAASALKNAVRSLRPSLRRAHRSPVLDDPAR